VVEKVAVVLAVRVEEDPGAVVAKVTSLDASLLPVLPDMVVMAAPQVQVEEHVDVVRQLKVPVLTVASVLIPSYLGV
jgi:hypothetical protein